MISKYWVVFFPCALNKWQYGLTLVQTDDSVVVEELDEDSKEPILVLLSFMESCKDVLACRVNAALVTACQTRYLS